jgi:hypothetical protein
LHFLAFDRYRHDRYTTARTALGIPIRTRVILGALVLWALFVFREAIVRRERSANGTVEAIETPHRIPARPANRPTLSHKVHYRQGRKPVRWSTR